MCVSLIKTPAVGYRIIPPFVKVQDPEMVNSLLQITEQNRKRMETRFQTFGECAQFFLALPHSTLKTLRIYFPHLCLSV